MNEFVPRGYLTLEKALEYFGQLKYPGEWEAEKASSKQEFRQLLFAETLPAKLFTGGKLLSLESSIWGGIEAEYIFASGWATIRGGNEYFPAEVRGPVLIEQSSIDALFDSDSDDPSQSSDSQHEPQEDAEAPQPDAETKGSDNAAPVSDNETAHPKLGGRPTSKKEIQEAGQYLLDNNEIDPTASWKTIGYKVRKRVQDQVGTTDDKGRKRVQEQVGTTDDKGLDDQTIRRHFKAIFDAHGKTRD